MQAGGEGTHRSVRMGALARRTSIGAAICLCALPILDPAWSAEAGKRPAKEPRPASERANLAKRLKLSPDRFAVIKTGDQAPGPNVLAFDANKDCSGGWCTCTGDKDCNDMFSGVCADPSTGGVCQIRGNEPRCRCKDPARR